MPVQCTCLYCGAVKVRPPSQVRPYCNRACATAGRQNGPVSKTCQHCGSAFSVPASYDRKGGGLYCGRRCMGAASRLYEKRPPDVRSKPCICAHCSAPFLDFPWGKRRFCTKSCARKAANGCAEDRLWAQIQKTNDCWLGIGRNGRHWKLRWNGKTKKVFAHRLAWELATGQPIPEGCDVCHTCDVGACVRNDEQGVYVLNGVEYPRWGHLFLGTPAVNNADKVAKDRQSKGARTGVAKLSPALVQLIRERLATGMSQGKVAREFHVTTPTIRAIVIGRTWKHVT